MAIDLITGHQSVSHISADQIATINNAMMDNFGANKVMRLVGGELTADGLTITISEGYWRVNGFDMEIQEGETLYIDPTTIGLSRIDDIYVEILQDIPTGAQRAEIYIALGEPSATPTAPDEPTAPYLNTDILLQIIKLARVTVSEGAMIMEDYSVAYNIVTPEDLAEVQTAVDTAETHATTALNMIRSFSNDDVYSTSKAYNVGDHVIYNNVIYKCITACSAGSWYVNKNCFSKTTLTTAVTALNSDLGNKSSASAVSGSTAFAKIATLNSDLTLKSTTITTQQGDWVGLVWVPNFLSSWGNKKLLYVTCSPSDITINNLSYYVECIVRRNDQFVVRLISDERPPILYTPNHSHSITFTLYYLDI